MVYKKITLIGSSPESFDEATDNALERANRTLDNVAWMEVENLGVEVENAEPHEYQATVQVAFRLENE
jgi:flavin-binding protein dodecin